MKASKFDFRSPKSKSGEGPASDGLPDANALQSEARSFVQTESPIDRIDFRRLMPSASAKRIAFAPADSSALLMARAPFFVSACSEQLLMDRVSRASKLLAAFPPEAERDKWHPREGVHLQKQPDRHARGSEIRALKDETDEAVKALTEAVSKLVAAGDRGKRVVRLSETRSGLGGRS